MDMTVFSKTSDLDCGLVSRFVVARTGTCYVIQPLSGLIPAAGKRRRIPSGIAFTERKRG